VTPGQSSSSPAASTGSAPAVAQARSKLKQARLLMARGNYDAAQALAQEADHLHAPLLPGEDTPQKVSQDIAHARTVVVPSNDPKALVSAARVALNRGDLDQAESLAKQADQASSVWSSMSHLWSDSPSKVLRDVAAARARKPAAMAIATASTKE